MPYRGVTTAGQVVPGLFKLVLSGTPNGNDCGKDLLRQHHQQYRH